MNRPTLRLLLPAWLLLWALSGLGCWDSTPPAPPPVPPAPPHTAPEPAVTPAPEPATPPATEPAGEQPPAEGEPSDAEPTEAPSGTGALTILYTNDIHAHFEPKQGKEGPSGGFLALDAQVRQVREKRPSVLLLDAGDTISGHPITYEVHQGVQGGAITAMMNLVGYDAMELGNHDFDNGQPALRGMIELARFQMLCANLATEEGQPFHPRVKPYQVFERGGAKIGVFGLILENLKRTTARENTVGLNVQALAPVARKMIAELDPQTDLIVCLSHQGSDEDLELARAVPGIDVIIGGHDHRAFPKPKKVGETLVCQAGSYLRTLGRLDLKVKDDRVASYFNRLLPLPPLPDKAGGELKQLVEVYQTKLNARLKAPIGKLELPWRRDYYGESNLGDWVADAFVKATGADFGLVNSGSLRTDLAAGTITVGDVMEIMPFKNMLCNFRVSGAELRRICERNAWAAVNRAHGVLQVAGLRYRYQETEDGKVEVLSVKLGEKDVQDDAHYTGVCVDFIVFDQPDKYFGFAPSERKRLEIVAHDALVEEVKRQATITPKRDDRIVGLRGPPEKSERVSCSFVQVFDGDTIQVVYKGEKINVRMLRINTPERDSAGYDEARQALQKLIGEAKLVDLEFERPGREARDDYKRLLAYVWVGDKNLNVEMVRMGHSRFWTRYGAGRYAESFRDAEGARKEGRE